MAPIPVLAIADVKALSQGPSIDSGQPRRASLARGKAHSELTERRQRSSTSKDTATVVRSHISHITDSGQSTTAPLLRCAQQSPICGSGRQPSTNITPYRQETVSPSIIPHYPPLGSPTSMPIIQSERSMKPPRGSSPISPPLTGQPYLAKGITEVVAGSEKRVIKIGIETEFEVAACHEDNQRAMLTDFVKNLANNHNTLVHKRHHRMQTYVRRYNYRGVYNKWCMVEEPSIAGNKCEPCKSSVWLPHHAT